MSGVLEIGVLTVEDEGVARELGKTRPGIEGGGRSSSVYISSKMFEIPTIAEGWLAKCARADSKCPRATYGALSATAKYPRFQDISTTSKARLQPLTSENTSPHSSATLLPPPQPD